MRAKQLMLNSKDSQMSSLIHRTTVSARFSMRKVLVAVVHVFAAFVPKLKVINPSETFENRDSFSVLQNLKGCQSSKIFCPLANST